MERLGDASTQGEHRDTAPAVRYLEELYAACCTYVRGERAGERVLRSVLPSLLARPPDADRTDLHRIVFEAAADADGASLDASASDLRSAMASLSLPSRAALFLVDAAGMRYAEAAEVLSIDVDDVSVLVASGRGELRTLLAPDVSREASVHGRFRHEP